MPRKQKSSKPSARVNGTRTRTNGVRAKTGGARIIARRSGIHGRGVFATAPIGKGERVIEYLGERISHKEADRRYADEHEWSPHTFLFMVDDKIVIDATHGGNTARWINHSCVPNCEIEEEDKRIFIHALRRLKPGEELLYDYNLVLDERHTPAAKKAHPCFCGSKKCRGTLLGNKR
ncbi:MAG: SET domain-containing protein [Burkholderiales bacterium]